MFKRNLLPKPRKQSHTEHNLRKLPLKGGMNDAISTRTRSQQQQGNIGWDSSLEPMMLGYGRPDFRATSETHITYYYSPYPRETLSLYSRQTALSPEAHHPIQQTVLYRDLTNLTRVLNKWGSFKEFNKWQFLIQFNNTQSRGQSKNHIFLNIFTGYNNKKQNLNADTAQMEGGRRQRCCCMYNKTDVMLLWGAFI